MKTALLAILAIFSVAIIPAYAAEVPFPVLTTDNWVGTDVQTFYPTNSTYAVVVSVYYKIPAAIEIPQTITWYDIRGQGHTINLSEEFNLKHFPEPVKEIEVLEEREFDRIDEILDAKKLELAKQKNSGFDKLRQCIAEFREEQPIRFEGWKRTASLEEFIIPDQWINADDYSRAELEAQKAWVICEALKKYKHIGVWEANKGLDENVNFKSLDTTDAEETDPVTAEDIAEEQRIAQEFQCSDEGKRLGLCLDYMTGEKYVVPSPRFEDWYGHYMSEKDIPLNLAKELEKARSTQCEIYYPLYRANNAVELPTWLSHCGVQ